MRVHSVILALLAAGVASVGCDERVSSVAGPTPTLEPTFSSIQREILERTDSSGCVNARSRTGAIRVVPGDPENSYLIHKLEGRPDITGKPMPLNGQRLTPGQILILKRWIAIGAPRN